jgi:CheY-like chemotaxis protein
LIVEDDDVSAKLIAATLESEGCETRRAASAEEALWILARFAPRAIVLDLVLPQMSGLVFAQLLKRDPATRDIVIIATSAFDEAEAGPLAHRVGCADYLRKPIDPISLPRVLLGHLGDTACSNVACASQERTA